MLTRVTKLSDKVDNLLAQWMPYYDQLVRDEFWAARDQLLGVIGEVEADAVTQNQDGSYSLRFPRHLRFRGFEPGEKL